MTELVLVELGSGELYDGLSRHALAHALMERRALMASLDRLLITLRDVQKLVDSDAEVCES